MKRALRCAVVERVDGLFGARHVPIELTEGQECASDERQHGRSQQITDDALHFDPFPIDIVVRAVYGNVLK